jgi:hypothetical protein
MTAAGELEECPRCGGWTSSPDDHLLDTAGVWRGGGEPLPAVRYCTTEGIRVRGLPAPPPPPAGRWGWSIPGGYRRLGGRVLG